MRDDELVNSIGDFLRSEIIGWQVEIAGRARFAQALDLCQVFGQRPVRSALSCVGGFRFRIEVDQHIRVAA